MTAKNEIISKTAAEFYKMFLTTCTNVTDLRKTPTYIERENYIAILYKDGTSWTEESEGVPRKNDIVSGYIVDGDGIISYNSNAFAVAE